jgi:hypothetical protein
MYRVEGKQPVTWHCKCTCGNEKDVRGSNLRNGNVQSCGCLKKEKCKQMGLSQLKDLTGQTFGYLTVIEKSDKKQGANYFWKCKCICGKIHEVAGAELTRGSTKSCGCKRKELIAQNKKNSMIGKKFGKLTVLEQAGQNSDLSFNYLCQCDCGKQKIINGVLLRKGVTTSCGCINYSIGEKYIQKILEENNINFIQEYTVKELNNKRFDFAIIENNKVIRFIEFDGRQHYEAYPEEWEISCPLEERQKRDKEKNQYAQEHNIPLVRIPYWERDKITLDMILGDQYLID